MYSRMYSLLISFIPRNSSFPLTFPSQNFPPFYLDFQLISVSSAQVKSPLFKDSTFVRSCHLNLRVGKLLVYCLRYKVGTLDSYVN